MNRITAASLVAALAILPATAADAATTKSKPRPAKTVKRTKPKKPKAPAVPAAPTTRHYTGQTELGGAVAFDLTGDVVSNVDTLMPIACANTMGASGTDGGAEPFRPQISATLGAGEQSVVARQSSAILLRDVDMTSKVDATRGAGQTVTGKLGLSYSTSNYNVFTNTITITTCFGTVAFTAQPA
jgi:hypothetical protein